MIAAIRRNPTGLTLLCLGGITTTFMLCVGLLIATNSGFTRPADPRPTDAVVTALLLLIAWPMGWWLFGRMAGGLWRMNDDYSWKFLMCTGALGLVLAALSCDLVVMTLVRRFYTGEKELKGCILNIKPIESRVRPASV